MPINVILFAMEGDPYAPDSFWKLARNTQRLVHEPVVGLAVNPRRRREVGAAGLSFLDCICCGFGAVILLLVIVKVHDPVFTEEQRVELVSLIAQLKSQMTDIDRDTEILQSELVGSKE